MSDETLAADEWIYAKLTGDATMAGLIGARVYAEMAPPTAAYPFVVTSHLSSVDVPTHNQHRIMVSGIWLVRGIVQDFSFNATLKAIAERIDVLLHRSTGGTANGGTAAIFTSHREQPFRMAEEAEGKSFRHLGGQYRIYIQ